MPSLALAITHSSTFHWRCGKRTDSSSTTGLVVIFLLLWWVLAEGLGGWLMNRPMDLITGYHLATEQARFSTRKSSPKPLAVFQEGSQWFLGFWGKSPIPLSERHITVRGERKPLSSGGYTSSILSTRYLRRPLDLCWMINSVDSFKLVGLVSHIQKSLES